MSRRAKLTVAYDGTSFHGFAENGDVRTVVGVLREAMEKVARQPIEVVGAGRTDAGVHAWGQVISCDLPDDIDLEAFERRVNRMCSPEVVVRSTSWADAPDFSARFSGTLEALPLPRLELGRAEPVPGRRPRGTSPQPLSLPALQLALRSVARRARLLVVLPSPQGRRGRAAAVDGAQGHDRQVVAGADRVRRRVCCASRYAPTPSATRWCAPSSAP